MAATASATVAPMTTTLALNAPRAVAVRVLDTDAIADHLGCLYRAALALCGSRAMAEDLVQETCVRVLAKPRLLRGGDDRRYLLRALRNTFFRQRQKELRKRTTEVSGHDVDLVAASRAGDPHFAAVTNELYRTIAALPPHHRDVLVAVDVVGLSYAEAASALGVPTGTVMSRLYRGRDAVARHMGHTR